MRSICMRPLVARSLRAAAPRAPAARAMSFLSDSPPAVRPNYQIFGDDGYVSFSVLPCRIETRSWRNPESGELIDTNQLAQGRVLVDVRPRNEGGGRGYSRDRKEVFSLNAEELGELLSAADADGEASASFSRSYDAAGAPVPPWQQRQAEQDGFDDPAGEDGLGSEDGDANQHVYLGTVSRVLPGAAAAGGFAPF